MRSVWIAFLLGCVLVQAANVLGEEAAKTDEEVELVRVKRDGDVDHERQRRATLQKSFERELLRVKRTKRDTLKELLRVKREGTDVPKHEKRESEPKKTPYPKPEHKDHKGKHVKKEHTHKQHKEKKTEHSADKRDKHAKRTLKDEHKKRDNEHHHEMKREMKHRKRAEDHQHLEKRKRSPATHAHGHDKEIHKKHTGNVHVNRKDRSLDHVAHDKRLKRENHHHKDKRHTSNVDYREMLQLLNKHEQTMKKRNLRAMHRFKRDSKHMRKSAFLEHELKRVKRLERDLRHEMAKKVKL